MKRTSIWQAMTGLALVALVWTGTAGAEEQFQTLVGIPAATMSHSELAAVEGKRALDAVAILGSKGLLSFVPGDTNNALVVFDPTGMNPRIPTLALLDSGAAFTFPKGNKNSPLILFDPNALLTSSVGLGVLGISLPNLPLTAAGPLGLPIPLFPLQTLGLPDLSALGLPDLLPGLSGR